MGDDRIPDPPDGYFAKGLGHAYASGLEREARQPGSQKIDTPRPTDVGVVLCRRQGPTQGRLPLGPPGSGRGFKDAPAPTREGFQAARAREDAKLRTLTGDELRAEDLRKLEAVVELADLGPAEDMDAGLTETECEAFPDMLARLERGRFPLSDRQRAWLDKVIARLRIDVPEEPEIGGELVPKHRQPKTRDDVSPAHAKAKAFLERDELDKRAAAKPRKHSGTKCADCGLPQFETPGGLSCDEGHGGAPSLPLEPSDCLSSPQSGEKQGTTGPGYLNREQYAASGEECRRAEDCQLMRGHGGSCDPRPEVERWKALHAALDAGKEGNALEKAMEPPTPARRRRRL
jgi:hypothetical protein